MDPNKAEAVKLAQDKRSEIRNFIRGRDNIQQKWLALAENIKSEDCRRDEFFKRKRIEDTKAIPLNVLKFIGTLKKAVRSIMRHKGGTPYSIVRSLFIYWDAAKTGTINSEELLACMKSLGVKVSLPECDEIVAFYRAPKLNLNEMDYHRLLLDLQQGEPSIIAFVSQSEDDARDKQELRFEEVTDQFKETPSIVKKFLEAVRSYLAKMMRNQGGTPHQHIRFLFQFYDYDYSNGLKYSELMIACRRKMDLAITEQQAKEIVAYYDRKHVGEICYEKFLEDVCGDVKPILSFTDLTPRGIAQAKKSLSANPFIPKPFAAPTNKVLEQFKKNIKVALVNKVNKLGGSVASWIHEAFVTWDPLYTGKISDWRQLQGAAKRLGVNINEEEAQKLIQCYDRFGTNEMHYNYLTKEIMEEDPHFLMDAKVVDTGNTISTRTPKNVQQLFGKIKKAINIFVQKSKNRLNPRDLLHGTFLRYDISHQGKISKDNFLRVLEEELRIIIDEGSLNDTVKWFDTNGSNFIDYNELTRQLYGADVITEKLVLPPIKSASSTNIHALKAATIGAGKIKKMNKSGGGRSLNKSFDMNDLNSSHTFNSNNPELNASRSLSLTKLKQVPEGFHQDHSTSVVGDLMKIRSSVTENPYVTSMQLQNMSIPTEFSVRAEVMDRNLDQIESPHAIKQREKANRTKILHEKARIEMKLHQIEEQRQKLIEDHKSKHK